MMKTKYINLCCILVFLINVTYGTQYSQAEVDFINSDSMAFKIIKLNVVKAVFYSYQNVHGLCCFPGYDGTCLNTCFFSYTLECSNTGDTIQGNEYFEANNNPIVLEQYITYTDTDPNGKCLTGLLSLIVAGMNSVTFAKRTTNSNNLFPGYPFAFPQGDDFSQPSVLSVVYAISKVCTPGFGYMCDKLCQVANTDVMVCSKVSGLPVCRFMFSGDQCQLYKSPCYSNPCLNFGVCTTDGYLNYKCECGGKTSGQNCEIVDSEDVYSCQRNGIILGGTKCICVAGSTSDDCAKVPCTPGYCTTGTCEIYGTSQNCVCDSKTHTGKFCEHQCPYPCVNGICILVNGAPQCTCFVGYEGKQCGTETTPTACPVNNQCANDAICQVNPMTTLYSCICPMQWSGRFCETSSCNLKNCLNGVCLSGIGCKCVGSFSGPNCDNPACLSNACNGQGQCIASKASGMTYCSCNNDYTGPNCDQPCIGGCGSFGKCQNGKSGPVCECDFEHYGNNCQYSIKTRECKLLNCQNGGVCQMYNDIYTCSCPQMWSGPQCTQFKCDHSTCIHGVCVYGVGCVCQNSWSGSICDKLACENDQKLCNNNGICSTVGEIKKCTCDEHSNTGTYCQYKCNEYCVNGKCQLNKENIPSCKCNPGFIGEACQKRNLVHFYVKLMIAVTTILAIFAFSALLITIVSKFLFKSEEDITRASTEDILSNTKSATTIPGKGWETWQLQSSGNTA